MLQPLPQIQICAHDVAITDFLLLPCCGPAVYAKPYLLRRCRNYLESASASWTPLPPGPVTQVSASTVADVLPLPLMLFTLTPSQVCSTTLLSQPFLPSCRSLCHKSQFAPLLLLSLPSRSCLAAALLFLLSQFCFAAVFSPFKLLLHICRHCRHVMSAKFGLQLLLPSCRCHWCC